MPRDVRRLLSTLPDITKVWFTCVFLTPVLIFFGFFDRTYLILRYNHVIQGYQLWRCLTAVFVSGISFKWIVKLYYIGIYSRKLEEETFESQPADYIFMLLCNWIFCVIGGLWIISHPVLMSAMVNSIVYSWCYLNPEFRIQFWLGTEFTAKRYPIVIGLIDLLIDYDWRGQLIGIISAQLYYYLTEGWTKSHGRPLLQTPAILVRLFPDNTNRHR